MGIEHRPYVGTWRLNNRQLVQHTPDVLVFVNGDTSLPGCPNCGGKIDIQKFITQVSVDLGVDPAAASASISMAVPLHDESQFHRDARFILRPGLEVHIYMRGYFPVQGQYRNVLPEDTGGIDITNLAVYPYYHVFHGVFTQVDHAYSGGFQDISVNCASMLHFWQYHNMSTNASLFGSRPSNSKLKMSLVGHNFTGMTPFSIIYTLFHDTAGAAGGVAYAISDKTNSTAKSTTGQGSLFSLNLRYWEERFKTRMVNLRMHGASGQLFNTAQAAFLGRLKGNQVRSLLNDQWKVKTGQHNTNAYDLLSAARSLNFLREVRDPQTGELKVEGVDVVLAEANADPSSPKGGGSLGMEVNVASMQAFVTDIGNWGQVNLFEGTYETKLDIANKVLEVTGWEFFQDADGDFVFKPPLYNLDTRSSRTYVIKDIDIISLNFSEKEPEVTYVTCNGSQFKNMKGTGLENEWGVRGQYIDYRLVAQFGWRPGSFETSYYTNPRAMFFAAVARLDVMNIGVNSASCTIPSRPELRPGYPVYIEFLDCFYYLQSFNHSVAFGGQSATSLTLVGKRAKFFAPGQPGRQDSGGGADAPTRRKGKSGIETINLSSTNLPQRPLQVLDEYGFPRLSGFPNVVMALDPNAVNPLYFVAGFDLEQIDNPRVLTNVLNVAESYNIVSLERESNSITKIVFHVDDNQNLSVDPLGKEAEGEQYSIRGTGLGERVFSFDQLVSVSRKYARLSSEPSKKLEDLRELIAQKDAAIKEKNSKIFGLQQQVEANPSDKSLFQQIKNLQNEVNNLRAAIRRLESGVASEQQILERSLIQDPDVSLLVGLLEQVVEGYQKSTDDFPKPSKTAALLDLLSDKKAVFSNGQQPGFYRYYSSASPNPEDQGQRAINDAEGEGGSEGEEVVLPAPRRVLQYLKEPRKPGPDGTLPEAELGEGEVRRGLRILRPNGEEVLSTDQIQTLSFARHDAEGTTNPTTYSYDDFYAGLNEEHRKNITGRFRNAAKNATLGQTIDQAFRGAWESLTDSWDGPSFPETLNFRGNSLVTATQLVEEVVPESSNDPSISENTVRSLLAEQLYIDTGARLRALWIDLTSIEDSRERDAAKKQFAAALRGAGAGDVQFKLGKREKKEKEVRNSFYSPVFPVSDAGGYEVIGTYAYGRGLQIRPNSTFEEITFTDPLAFADPQAVEDYISVLRGDTPSSLSVLTSNNERSGVPAAKRAQNEAEIRLLESIRDNPSTPDSLKNEVTHLTQTGSGLSNWIARQNEGISKLPVGNAAFFLGDLQIHVDKQRCGCRAASADILIDALTTERFVTVLPPNVDTVSQFSSDLMIEKGRRWEVVREALRGGTKDTLGRAVTDANRSGVRTWNSGASGEVEDLNNALEEVQSQAPPPDQTNAEGQPLSPEEQATSEGNTPSIQDLADAFGDGLRDVFGVDIDEL